LANDRRISATNDTLHHNTYIQTNKQTASKHALIH